MKKKSTSSAVNNSSNEASLQRQKASSSIKNSSYKKLISSSTKKVAAMRIGIDTSSSIDKGMGDKSLNHPSKIGSGRKHDSSGRTNQNNQKSTQKVLSVYQKSGRTTNGGKFKIGKFLGHNQHHNQPKYKKKAQRVRTQAYDNNNFDNDEGAMEYNPHEYRHQQQYNSGHYNQITSTNRSNNNRSNYNSNNNPYNNNSSNSHRYRLISQRSTHYKQNVGTNKINSGRIRQQTIAGNGNGDTYKKNNNKFSHLKIKSELFHPSKQNFAITDSDIDRGAQREGHTDYIQDIEEEGEYHQSPHQDLHLYRLENRQQSQKLNDTKKQLKKDIIQPSAAKNYYTHANKNDRITSAYSNHGTKKTALQKYISQSLQNLQQVQPSSSTAKRKKSASGMSANKILAKKLYEQAQKLNNLSKEKRRYQNYITKQDKRFFKDSTAVKNTSNDNKTAISRQYNSTEKNKNNLVSKLNLSGSREKVRQREILEKQWEDSKQYREGRQGSGISSHRNHRTNIQPQQQNSSYLKRNPTERKQQQKYSHRDREQDRQPNQFQKQQVSSSLSKIKERQSQAGASSLQRQKEKQTQKLKQKQKLNAFKWQSITNQKKKNPYDLSSEQSQTFGDRFPDGFQKLKLLGRGGFSLVWLGQHKKSKKKYAIKQIITQSSHQTHIKQIWFGTYFFEFGGAPKQQFKKHPGINNLVKLYYYFINKKDTWILYEKCGDSLGNALYELKGENYLGEKMYRIYYKELYSSMKHDKNKLLKKIILEVAKSLQLLSQNNIVHSDLKTENILVRMKEKEDNIIQARRKNTQKKSFQGKGNVQGSVEQDEQREGKTLANKNSGRKSQRQQYKTQEASKMSSSLSKNNNFVVTKKYSPSKNSAQPQLYQELTSNPQLHIAQVKLIDYGSSFVFNNLRQFSMATPQYMAPQILNFILYQNELQYIPKLLQYVQGYHNNPWVIDMWSLGSVVLEIISGIPLWMSLKTIVRNKKQKQVIRLGLFAIKGRTFDKIIKKQLQVIQSLDYFLQNQNYSGIDLEDDVKYLLKRMLSLNPENRISPEQIVQFLDRPT